MRLMLGRTGQPDLLVSVEDYSNKNEFTFSVVNGNWQGKFINGFITIQDAPSGAYTSLIKMEVLCDDQDRLYGKNTFDYNTVFYEYENLHYKTKYDYKVKQQFDDWIDDISF